MAKKYLNIPVSPETYINVKLLAEANGLGPRGMGEQVKQWAERELPPCDHLESRVPVEVETFPNQTILGSQKQMGWYCPLCRRVYHRSEKVPA